MMKRSRILQRMLWSAAAMLCAPAAFAAYVTTGMQQNLDIFMDNGVTYFRGDFTTSGNCLYNRLELRDTGDYTGSVENGRSEFEATSVNPNPSLFRSVRYQRLEARIVPQRIEHGIEPEQRRSKWHVCSQRAVVRYRKQFL